MINQAMFLRNGKSGYVLKPASLRPSDHKIKDVVTLRKKYALEVTVISAQQLPRPRDKDGRDKIDKSTMDPYVQIALYVPDWPGAPKSASSQEDKDLLSTQTMVQSTSPPKPSNLRRSMDYKPASSSSRYVLRSASTPAKVIRVETDAVKNNGFNPSWQTCLKLKFEVAGDMLDLVFIRFSIRNEGDAEDERALAMYCTSLGSLKQGRPFHTFHPLTLSWDLGYRHLPLHDQQMTQYLFSTLFIHTNLRQIDL
jgi:phosphatidylinositol phospholipase C delta